MEELPYLDPSQVNINTDFVITENIETGKTRRVRISKLLPEQTKTFNWYNKPIEIYNNGKAGYHNISYEITEPLAKAAYISWEKWSYWQDRNRSNGNVLLLGCKTHDDDDAWSTRSFSSNGSAYNHTTAKVNNSFYHGDTFIVPVVKSDDGLTRGIYIRFHATQADYAWSSDNLNWYDGRKKTVHKSAVPPVTYGERGLKNTPTEYPFAVRLHAWLT